MIYFVSYVLGLVKRGRENSENAISDDLEGFYYILDLPEVSLEWVLIGYIRFIMRSPFQVQN
jgi:hypothetical protein